MKLKIKSSEEFERLLDSLANELVNANIYFKLHSDLIASIPVYEKELNESSTFWTLTFQSHLDAALFRLCRVYDTHPKSNSLANLLDTIKANLYIFDEMNFRERLKDNPFVDSLAQSARKPDLKQLDEDREYASENNPLVNTLLIWRNNIFAHRNAKNITRKKNLVVEYPFSKNNVSDLLKKGISILNHYSGLFRAVSHSTQIVGHDDYKHVLSYIRAGLKYREEKIETEIRKYQKGNVE
jgi:hypothetical protein